MGFWFSIIPLPINCGNPPGPDSSACSGGTDDYIQIMDKLFNSLNKVFVRIKMSEIVHLAFQDVPEAFNWSIVHASPDTRHTLLHFLYPFIVARMLQRKDITNFKNGISDFMQFLRTDTTISAVHRSTPSFPTPRVF